MKPFSISCQSCGRDIAIPASKAGAEVDCECGAQTLAPRLSELRKQAGMGAYETSVLDTIALRIRDGKLPGSNCQLTGRPVTDILEVEVLCEKVWAEKKSENTQSPFSRFLRLTAIGYLLWLMRGGAEETEDVELRGRERRIALPLRICSSRHDEVRAMSHARLRELLIEEPLYAKLYEEFPDTEIVRVMPSLS